MKNGEMVGLFERDFAQYVGAKYAIAASNGTVTLQAGVAALPHALGRWIVPPLTMSATTIGVLNARREVAFIDVDAQTWLVPAPSGIGVSLYGLHYPGLCAIDDAAQTLRPHNRQSLFTSYSFQASKILSTGEGGMLTTDDEGLAVKAREYLSLGYRMTAQQPRIDPSLLKSPTFERHYSLGANGRMNDLTAAEGLKKLDHADQLLADRRKCAEMYTQALDGCRWLDPQVVPPGSTHDYWCFPVLIHPPVMLQALQGAIVRHGGERSYACWKLTYQEPAFRHLAPDGTCPIAESLQPRLLQMATNSLASAERNATALSTAIKELS